MCGITNRQISNGIPTMSGRDAMIKRRSAKNTDNYPSDWVVSLEYTLANGRVLRPGDEFTTKGEVGSTFRFVRHVRNGGRYGMG
jgi:hypothetical protein